MANNSKQILLKKLQSKVNQAPNGVAFARSTNTASVGKKRELLGRLNTIAENQQVLKQQLSTLAEQDRWQEKTTEKTSTNAKMAVSDGSYGVSRSFEKETPWYKSGAFEDGYDFGDVIKFILGVDDKKTRSRFTGIVEDKDDAEQMLSTMTSTEIEEKKNSATTGEDRRYYDDLAIQKQVAEIEEKLSKVTLENGTTLLEEVHAVAEMEDGKEKKERKKALEEKMLKAGVNADMWYSMLTGDKNITWTTAKKFAGEAINKGLGSFNTSLTGFLDLTVGAILKGVGWEDNPISKLDDYYEDQYAAASHNLELAKARMGAGGWADGVGNLTEGTVAALPQAIMAIATMGGSTAPSLTTTAAQATGSILQNAGITIKQMLKNPQFWTSFVTTYANDYEDAKKNGADDLTAGFSATITSMMNAGVEVGGGIQTLPGNLKGKGNKAITEWVKSTLEEGGEEVVQGIISDSIAKGLYDSDREIANPGEMLQEFGMGAAVGGILGGGQVGVASAINTGVNAVEKHQAKQLNENEQKVVNKVYEDELVQKEKNGKLTAREKSKLYDKVLEDLEQGRISTDTIESVLGGDTYKGYQDALEQESKLKKEIEELESLADNAITVKQRERLAEARKELEGLDVKTAKSNLFNQVDKLTANDTKLRESYNERTRRGQAFTADLTKYDAQQQETVKRAIESGILNNSNRTHEFVDLIAKISANKGVSFNFADNAKLKESGFAIDGKQVNGFVTADGVTVNINSAKALNSVVGHEITHVLEGTELYNELQSAIVEYAKSKGDYQGRYDTLTELYKDIEGADIDAELTADLVGDYLFTDADFVQRLSTEHRGVFQKLFDEIKYLCKLATAGTKEARELEKVKKLFEDAYRTETKNPTADGGVKYSITEGMTDAERYAETEQHTRQEGNRDYDKPIELADVFVLRSIGRKSVNQFTAEDIQKAQKWAHKYFEDLGVKSPFFRAWFGDWRAVDKTPIEIVPIPKIGIGDFKEFVKNQRGTITNKDTSNGNETGWQIRISSDGENNTRAHAGGAGLSIEALTAVRSLVENSILLDTEVHEHHSNNSKSEQTDRIAFDHKLYSLGITEDNRVALYRITVEEKYQDKKHPHDLRFHNLKYIEKVADFVPGLTYAEKRSADTFRDESTTIYNISDLYEFVKNFDGEFNPGDIPSVGLVNSDGTPKVMYHGSPKQFTVFDRSKAKGSGLYGRGFYFTDSKDQANVYGNEYSVYLDVKHPLQHGGETVSRDQVRSFLETVAENEDYSIENYGTYDVDSILDIVMGGNQSGDAFQIIQDISATAIGDMVEAAELFNSINKTEFDGIIVPTETVVFRPEQIKSATDNIGTFDGNNPDIRYSLSEQGTAPAGDYRITGEDIALAPTREDIVRMEQERIATAQAAPRNDVQEITAPTREDIARMEQERNAAATSEVDDAGEELGAPTREDILQMEMERELYGDWRMTDPLDRKVEKLYRLMLLEKISEEDYNAQLVKADRQYQQRGSRVEDALERIQQAYSTHQAVTADESAVKQKEVEAVLGEKGAYVSKQANALYDEVKSMQKGKRVSNSLSYLLDTLDLSEENKAESYGSLRTALLNIRDNPNQTVNPNSAVEAAAREMLGREYDAMAEDFASAEGVAKDIYTKMESLRTELENNQSLREQSNADFDSEIARLQAEYDGKKNKNTKAANDILRRIERIQRLKSQVDADYGKRIDRLGEQLERISKPEYKTAMQRKAKMEEYTNRTAMQRKAKMEEYTNRMAELVGDTSTWVDKKMGLSYSTNTFRRNLRDIVRDENGNRDIAKADAIYEELQGKYNHNEAELKRESMRIKEVFQKLGLNHAEDTYAHMLGEFQYNPDSKLSQEQLEEYYEKHKSKIDTEKVDKAIAAARKVFDDLIVRVNERLKEQRMKQIPYRKGYFPHFTNPKQTWLHKLFNWKPVDNEIPTSIAGLTEEFNPQRSWQSFNKQRTSDATDYSLEQGLDSYIHGALDWIYHIEDIQKRRALENHIRYVHSDEGIKKRIDEIRNNESYDADEAQELIDAVYAEAKNPLNNFVTDLRTGTNTLANKKSSMDRKAEEMTNRKIYSVMTNLNSRINANMVVGSFSSALTNFIPITQSWMEVSPVYSLKGMRDTIKATFWDDGVVNKSDFLTNRLLNEEKLYQTGWDKVSEKAGIMMEAIDSFTSQTVWRSKYLQNISEGMSETEAIKNADQFAENVIAGRSRGNQPTIFDAKNPITKIFTAFQLEVANQYGYMFKDAPQDSKNKGRLIKGYATAFLGAYAYNALYSSLVGRDAAFDPISILEDLFRDLFGDDEEEPEEAFLNLVDNVLEEVPFVGGLIGGGRVPLSSAIPYEGDYTTFITDLANGELSAKEMLKPLYYLAMPVAGGQLKKTNEGLKMFDEDLPVAGSYTESGNLRFPVEDDSIADWLQAALFGQYASKNAREYFDNGWAPLKEKQIEEFASLGIPIADYREIRKRLGKLETTADKVDYIGGLDLTVEQKNILVNNVVDRKEPVDMTGYDLYEDFDEFDFYIKNQEKYQFLKDNGIDYKTYKASEESREAYNWAFQNPEKYQTSRAVTEDTVTYKSYTKALSEIKADKDSSGNAVSGSRKKKVVQYINGLDAEYGAKLVLYKMEYPSDDTYNGKIVQYVSGIEGFTFEQKATVLKELGFTVTSDGRVTWD